jgi:hypothetical protein
VYRRGTLRRYLSPLFEDVPKRARAVCREHKQGAEHLQGYRVTKKKKQCRAGPYGIGFNKNHTHDGENAMTNQEAKISFNEKKEFLSNMKTRSLI